MNRLREKTMATLLIAIFMISAFAMTVMGGVPTNAILTEDGDGYAKWSILGGTYRVELDTGTSGAGRGSVRIPIDYVLLSALTVDPSYYVNEPSPVSGGKSPPELGGHHPWGQPYINLVLDLDGDPNTVDKDWLEGLGSSNGPIVSGEAVKPDPDAWTLMSVGFGYYDGDDSLDSLGGFSGTVDGVFVAHSLAEWQTMMATAHPDAKVVEVQICYGSWPPAVGELCSPVYVDDMTIDGVMYNLEPASDVDMSATAVAYIPDKVSISVTPPDVSFGPIDEGGSGFQTVSVDNTGDLTVKVTASLMDEDPADFYTDNLGLGPDLPAVTPVNTWFITDLEPEDLARTVYLQLNIPWSTPSGSKTATLIFWAEEA